MANHSGTNRLVAGLKPRFCTTMRGGILCPSQLEAHYGDVLEYCGIEFAHEAVKFSIPNLPSGRTTPDYLFADPFNPGCYSALESKGPESERGVATFDAMERIVQKPESTPGIEITGYLMGHYQKLKLATRKKTGPAALYQCRECADNAEHCHGYHFAHKEPAHCCPFCGATPASIVYITDNLNDYAREVNEALWQPNWEKTEAEIKARQAAFDEAKDYERRLRKRFDLAKQILDWPELLDGEHGGDIPGYKERPDWANGLRIETPYAYEGVYIPDLYYPETPDSVHLMRFVTPPIAIISILEEMSENDAIVMEHIHDLITAKAGHEFVKHILADHNGCRVLDWNTNGRYEPGAIYTCKKCRRHSITPHGAECPYCGAGSTSMEQYTKEKARKGKAA